MLHVPHLDVHLRDDSRAAYGIPDGVCLVPYHESGVDPVDVHACKRDPAVPAGLEAHVGRVRDVPSDGDKLHCVLLHEQRMS